VCKYQETIAEIIEDEAVPIDFYTATCRAYLPEDFADTAEAINEAMEDAIDSMGEGMDIVAALNQMLAIYYQKGMVPLAIHLNSRVMAVLHHAMAGSNPLLNVPGARLTSISTKYGKLQVIVDEAVPDGTFFISTTYGKPNQ
jgi:hypothetical protein